MNTVPLYARRAADRRLKQEMGRHPTCNEAYVGASVPEEAPSPTLPPTHLLQLRG